jgi:formylglycine-generating enzyme required for sulfatase activity
MSDAIIVALIGLVGAIASALISGYFVVYNNEKKGKKPKPKPINWLLILFGGIIGLIIGLSLVALRSPSTTPMPTQTLTETPVVFSTFPLFDETTTLTETITPTSTFTLTPTFTPTSTFTPTNTFTPTPIVIRDNNVSMILIPSGTFNKYDTEKKTYIKVNLPDFYIDQHEVTNDEYQKCVDAGVCGRPFEAGNNYKNVENFGDPAYKNYPVVLISYNRAKAYCEWRSNGTRLPTGEEWEKAARGKLVEQTYPWGNNPPSCEFGALNGTNYSGCGSQDAFPVMSFVPNGYGLFDMSGNVSEWVDEANKLIRGGSWNANESQIKVFSSVEGNTFEGYVNVGFRCAKDAP